ncbi:MAG: hypothetical protein ACJAYU_000207 [Bradymonadia bacterium]|jgi:hypothetical protein
MIRTFILAFALVTGCGRTDSQLWLETPNEPVETDVGLDAPDAPTVVDVEPTESALEPAPEIDTPRRSEELDALYCGLQNGHLVKAGLRAAACLAVPIAGVMDDASRGFVPGELLTYGYAPATYGGCEFLVCLSNADNCEDARVCETERTSGECGGSGRRCDGNLMQECLWVEDQFQWIDVIECARIDGACVEEGCVGANCTPWATCEVEDSLDFCDPFGRCDGDAIVRCLQGSGDAPASEVRIECGELVRDGTCFDVPIGGEFPGPSCLSSEAVCTPAFAEGFACEGTRISLCLFGEIAEFDCQSYGYEGCEDEGFFGVRCF